MPLEKIPGRRAGPETLPRSSTGGVSIAAGVRSGAADHPSAVDLGRCLNAPRPSSPTLQAGRLAERPADAGARWRADPRPIGGSRRLVFSAIALPGPAVMQAPRWRKVKASGARHRSEADQIPGALGERPGRDEAGGWSPRCTASLPDRIDQARLQPLPIGGVEIPQDPCRPAPSAAARSARFMAMRVKLPEKLRPRLFCGTRPWRTP